MQLITAQNVSCCRQRRISAPSFCESFYYFYYLHIFLLFVVERKVLELYFSRFCLVVVFLNSEGQKMLWGQILLCLQNDVTA